MPRLAADSTRSPFPPTTYRELEGYEWFVATMHAAGAATVLFVIPPTPALPAIGDIAPMLDRRRIAVYRNVLRELPRRFPHGVVIADMASWYEAQGDPPSRADGLHWTLDAAVEVAEEFLVPAISRAA